MIAWIYLVAQILLSCPDDMVKVPETLTCIDRYEWPNKKGVLPLVGLSGLPEAQDSGKMLDADSLCKSVDKRVCQIEEWISSCKDQNNSDYPWGSASPKTFTDANAPCNMLKPVINVNQTLIMNRNQLEFAKAFQAEPSGFRSCVSASGAEDMIGNVEEWVRCPNRKYGWCLMGRFWALPKKCTDVIDVHVPRWHYYETGVRCCKDLWG